MPSTEALILSEVLVGVLTVFKEKAIAAGIEAEEVNKMIAESVSEVWATDPANLPDGR